MSVLTICQNAARALSISVPSSLVSSTNKNAQVLLQALARAGSKRAREKDWPQLIREHSVTLSSGDNSYAIPGDFMSWVSNTSYDVSNSRPMVGPLTNTEWATEQYGITSQSPFKKFRIAGRSSQRILIDPTPGAGEAGQTISFLYKSGSWIYPKAWAASTVYETMQCVSASNELIYCTPLGGTSGSTEPTHTSGTASDGGVTWAIETSALTTPKRDDDNVLFDEDLMTQDVIWTFRKLRGFDYRDLEVEANELWDTHFVDQKGATRISMVESPGIKPIGLGNLPDTGFGL